MLQKFLFYKSYQSCEFCNNTYHTKSCKNSYPIIRKRLIQAILAHRELEKALES